MLVVLPIWATVFYHGTAVLVKMDVVFLCCSAVHHCCCNTDRHSPLQPPSTLLSLQSITSSSVQCKVTTVTGCTVMDGIRPVQTAYSSSLSQMNLVHLFPHSRNKVILMPAG